MSEQAYTLASCRVIAGREVDFLAAWNELAATFAVLPHPPVSETLIRHRSERTLFYAFGLWRSSDHVRAMRENAQAQASLGRLRELCHEMTPGDFEVVVHVDLDPPPLADRAHAADMPPSPLPDRLARPVDTRR